MHCTTCAAEVREGAKFCGECGTPLALKCPTCGAGHRPDQRFCSDCGGALAEQTPTAPAAAETETSAPVAPDGEQDLGLASVLFVDLVGFTTLSESRDPEDVRELLSGYLDSARTIVERYGGVVEKFLGDAVTAVWGIPKASENDAELAVRAALEVVDAVHAFGEGTGAPDVRGRAGVVSGQVTAERIVLGDLVNTAAHVQIAAEPGGVLVDETTRQATSAAIAYADAGEHALKGTEHPARLWRAVRALGGAGGKQREQGLEAPLIARDADLRLLKDLFHAGIERGVARLVALSGPAGVGKTRLAREFDNYTDGLADDFFVHAGRCLPYGEGVAYWALAEMVRQRFGIAEDAAADETSAKLAAGLDRWIIDPSDREFLHPRLGALLGVAEPGLSREELFAGWRLFLERLAAIAPVVLVFEDLQWADLGLLDFIEHLLEWATESPIFILVLARPELAERREGWPGGRRGATTIHLEPLADAAIGELLDEVVVGLPSDSRAKIVSQAEGIPLYAIETIRALANRGDLAEQHGRFVLTGELGDVDIPATLSSLLAARLDGLAPEERDLIRIMSVFGGAFSSSSAAALTGLTDDQLTPLLEKLVRKQVLAVRADPLSPERGQYAFAQTLLRTVAYDMLSRRERKVQHAAAAAHLREASADGGDEAEVIAAHLLAAYEASGGDADAADLREQALAELHRVAHRAETVGAPERAEQAYRTALDMVDDDETRLKLTEAAAGMAKRAARWEEAVELYEAVIEMHQEAGRQDDARRVIGLMARPLRYADRGDEAFERMRRAVAELDPGQLSPEVAELNLELGLALSLRGNREEAAEPLERALTAAEALELPALLCEALTTAGFGYGFAGRVQQERALYQRAMEIAEAHELSPELMAACAYLGESLAQTDSPEADDANLRSLKVARRIGDRSFERYVAGNVMYRSLLTGDWEGIDALVEEVLGSSGEETGEEFFVHQRLIHLAVLRGQLDVAAEHIERRDAGQDATDFEFEVLSRAAEAAVLLAHGRGAEAHDRALAVLDETPRLGATHEAIRTVWPLAVEAALASGRLESAAALVEVLASRPPGLVPPMLRAELRRNRGLLAAARGDDQAVEKDLTEAVVIYRELRYPYLRARAENDLGAWLAKADRHDDASVLLDSARMTFARLGVGVVGEVAAGTPTPSPTRTSTPV